MYHVIILSDLSKSVSVQLRGGVTKKSISYEIICVNDCSSDGTEETLKNIALEHRNIVLINNQMNLGVSYCRNRGLKFAQGKWVWFVDSDDLIVPGAADLLLDVGEYYNADMVVGKFNNIPETYKLNKEEYGFGKEIDELGLNISQLPMSMDGDIGAGMCMCITQKAVFTNNELCFNEQVGMLEDGLMHWELEQVDLMVARVKECVYLYRFNPCSASNKITEEKLIMNHMLSGLMFLTIISMKGNAVI